MAPALLAPPVGVEAGRRLVELVSESRNHHPGDEVGIGGQDTEEAHRAELGGDADTVVGTAQPRDQGAVASIEVEAAGELVGADLRR